MNLLGLTSYNKSTLGILYTLVLSLPRPMQTAKTSIRIADKLEQSTVVYFDWLTCDLLSKIILIDLLKLDH